MTEHKQIATEINLGELFKKTLVIPAYQRPYTWVCPQKGKNIKNQIEPLLFDIKEQIEKEIDLPYLMGTIIIYINNDDKNKIEIVDGQQRLTTLSILLYCLNNKYDNGLLNQNFSHSQSKINIQENYTFINDWIIKKSIDKEKWSLYLLKNVMFVLVTAPTLDDAFTFFDSQNSRGKGLEGYDLVKAHHLRFIMNSQLATKCAQDWEKIDKRKGLKLLIHTFLGRIRKWSRKEDARQFDALVEFKAQRHASKTQFKLNRYNQPPIFSEWIYRHGQEFELTLENIDATFGTKKVKIHSESQKYFPFQITQPLEGGEQFFWFINKYDFLYNELFNEGNIETSITFKTLYKTLRDVGTELIFEVYEACLIFYYDKFGIESIDEIAMWLEHSLFYLRHKQYSVQEKSIYKYIAEWINPILLINEASFPEYIIEQLKDFCEGKYTEEINTFKPARIKYHEKINGNCGFYKSIEITLPISLKPFKTKLFDV